MTGIVHPDLASWADFYVIVGSAAAALIGIQFVVITLVGTRRKRTPAETIGAFATPTVVHLGGALLVSALMSVPWASPAFASVPVAACGVAGLGYGAVVIRRARRQDEYEPIWEDWLWHAILPEGAYAGLALAALVRPVAPQAGDVTIGASALALLMIGIHNAWDTVTHIVVTGISDDSTRPE